MAISNKHIHRSKIQFPFGITESGSIIHVSRARSGANCGCFCPACNAPLVARKGKKKAWHFAHASGKSCGLSLISSLSKLFIKLIGEQNALKLPSSIIQRAGEGERLVAFDNCVLITEQHDHCVMKLHSSSPFDSILLVLTVNNSLNPVPDNPDNISVCRITLQDALNEVATNPENQTLYNEEWYSKQLLQEAARNWQSNSQNIFPPVKNSDELYFSHKPPYHDESSNVPDLFSVNNINTKQFGETLTMSTPSHSNPTNAKIKREDPPADHPLKYRDLLDSPIFDGESILVDDWRNRVLKDLILSKVQQTSNYDPQKIGFTDMDVIRFLAKGIFRNPNDLLPKGSSQDDISTSLPTRKPKDIITDYLAWLWDLGMIRSRPGRDLKSVSGPFDQRLATICGPDWSASEMLITIIKEEQSQGTNHNQHYVQTKLLL